MARSIFSWMHPAGCFGLPELKDNRCAVCGNLQVDCTCIECEYPVVIDGKEQKCGVHGCLEHMLDRELLARIEVLESQMGDLRNEAARRETPTLPCPICGEVQSVSIYNNGPYSCHGFFYAGERHGWIKKERY